MKVNPYSEYLQTILKAKADVQDLRELKELKSNKVDTESAMQCIDIVHKQLSHVIVLFIEFLKTNITNKKDTEAGIQIKRMKVL